MKSLTYITVLAAFVFGFMPTEISASNAGPEIQVNNGKVILDYNEANEVLVLKVYAPGAQERVRIMISNAKGQFVHAEDALVDRRGTSLKIPMSDLEDGFYSLKIIGSKMQFEGDFEKL